MSPENETKPNDPGPERAGNRTAETGRARTADVKQQAAPEEAESGRPDEGIRPDRLTSENDGGSQG